MKTNKEWHLANIIPQNATLDERIVWHLAHKQNCGCRPVPPKLVAQMAAKGIDITTTNAK